MLPFPKHILKISRRQYVAARPWKNNGVIWEHFEEILTFLAVVMTDEIHL